MQECGAWFCGLFSATLLPPTKAEHQGIINREKFLGISGRSRTVQLQLAERYGIRGFSTPAGGCLLTDKNFSEKLRDLFADQLAVTPADIRLLAVGRHFRIDTGVKIVLGRDKKENGVLMSLASDGYHLFVPHGFPGPVALLSGNPTQELKQTVGRLIITYSKQAPIALTIYDTAMKFLIPENRYRSMLPDCAGSAQVRKNPYQMQSDLSG